MNIYEQAEGNIEKLKINFDELKKPYQRRDVSV